MVGDGAVMEGGVVVVLRVRELRWRVPAPGFVDGRELRRVGGMRVLLLGRIVRGRVLVGG